MTTSPVNRDRTRVFQSNRPPRSLIYESRRRSAPAGNCGKRREILTAESAGFWLITKSRRLLIHQTWIRAHMRMHVVPGIYWVVNITSE